MIVIGIDPGENIGIAIYCDGKLAMLETYDPPKFYRRIISCKSTADLIVMEDSRKIKRIFTAIGRDIPATQNITRAVGSVDARCADIVGLYALHGIKVTSISPKGKGSKLKAAKFNALTGWERGSNQHERDAAMLAWPYRMATK